MQALDLTGLKVLIAKALSVDESLVRDSYSKTLNDKTAYLTLHLLTSTQKGREYKFIEGEKEVITSTREAVVSVNAFGKNANFIIEKLNTLFYSSECLKGLKILGLGLVTISPIRNLSQIVGGGGVEERSSIDLTLSYINRVEVSQNEIKTAEIKTADFGIKVNR